MKKICIAIFSSMLVLALVGCGDKKASSNITTENKTNTEIKSKSKDIKKENKEPTQQELNEKLKKEAVKADFVKINGHEKENANLKVFAEGKISCVDYKKVMDVFPSFSLKQKEGKGYGLYHITNLFSKEGFKDGDIVRIYGTVNKVKSKTGYPKIIATVIEKK
ncbi:hypothetical protein G8S49_11070 [Clostridium botulinum C]|uniref:Lipoprotein n=2 Tax=Clostridium botulinum TaxID=1491 RepID=A0A9Q4TL86_CLOBO|nr:hypothetical protein [Clostridium botulinum]EGO86269.1 hypothetical protein CBCST_22770 [Clostridium botulinum C str. Stockholm]MCD3195693.1 hypothetical protein [Clostridium botulinum C]MCD3201109.1 hypothetical protein [Clostridium botulinum C]MCD3206639.1 hypothetical protein [Clostridium botulinum C]MCD3209362.1 hypothetical protein [Clostridium botulinum C]